MSDEPFDEQQHLLDEDPALDYILYEEMEKESKNDPQTGGCLTLAFVLSLPFSGTSLVFSLLQRF